MKKINWNILISVAIILITGCLFWAGVVWWIYEATK